MNAKELQQQYAANHPKKNKSVTVSKKKPFDEHIASHVRESAYNVSIRIGIEGGIRFIRDGFSEWPEMIDDELEKLRERVGV